MTKAGYIKPSRQSITFLDAAGLIEAADAVMDVQHDDEAGYAV